MFPYPELKRELYRMVYTHVRLITWDATSMTLSTDYNRDPSVLSVLFTGVVFLDMGDVG